MRILHVNETLGFTGGAEQYLHSVAVGLNERGHENFLIYRSVDERGPAAFARPFQRCEQLGVRQGGTLLQDLQPDVAYVHRWADMENLGRLGREVPVVRFVHDHELYCLRAHKFFYLSGEICHLPVGPRCLLCLPFSRRFGPFHLQDWPQALPAKERELEMNRSLAHIVVASHYMKSQLLMNGFAPERISVLPLFAQIPRERTDPPNGGERILLYVGQIVRSKGLDLLLRALPRLSSPCSLLVAGTGNWEQRCHRIARRLGLDSRVQFLGWQFPEALPGLLQRANLVVMPSRWAEPFGLVGLEAMAYGRPVVAFGVG
ncbi:MAG: glycosyltransferase family 4 protein, partial [candidate division NC10 bacterium]